jgi:serine/threonine protein kinase
MASSLIGRFKVGKKLGAGNQGTVYLCADPELQRRVAIKVLDKTVLGSQEASPSMKRESTRVCHFWSLSLSKDVCSTI